jgi:hypothetical protein
MEKINDTVKDLVEIHKRMVENMRKMFEEEFHQLPISYAFGIGMETIRVVLLSHIQVCMPDSNLHNRQQILDEFLISIKMTLNKMESLNNRTLN